MKNLVSSFRLWLLVVAVLGVLVSVSQGSVVVTTAPSVGPPPSSSVSYGAYSGRVLSCLSTETSPITYPASSQYMYSSAPVNLHWGDITVDNSDQSSVWLGQVITDALSPFYGEKGTAFYVNLKVVGDGVHKFSADDISFTVTSTDSAHSLSGSGTLAGLTYGVDPIVGVLYGPDGIIKTYDDSVYNRLNPASGSTKVDYIIYSGVAVAYDATNVGLGAVQDYVDSVAPFNVTITYTVNDGTGSYSSSQTRTVVPEPATLALLSLGAITLIRRRQRSRQQ